MKHILMNPISIYTEQILKLQLLPSYLNQDHANHLESQLHSQYRP